MPLISVIVPVYRVEKYIRRCVDSILAQTFTDFELILVDDGSPDLCPAICDEYAEKDSRIRVIHKENGGLSSARNAGIDWAFSNSNSEWLFFVDSDDWIHTETLELLYGAAQRHGVSVSVGGYQKTCGDALIMPAERQPSSCISPEPFFLSDGVTAVVAWGKLYRKFCFEQLRYPVGKIHEDEYVTYRILFALPSIAVVDLPLYAYYQNPTGIMGSAWSPKRLDFIQALEEQISFFQSNAFHTAYHHRLRSYVFLLAHAEKQLAQNPDFRKYLPEVRKKRRKCLNLCIRSKCINIAYEADVFIAACPSLKFLWKVLAFLKYAPNKAMLRVFGEENYQRLKKLLGK